MVGQLIAFVSQSGVSIPAKVLHVADSGSSYDYLVATAGGTLYWIKREQVVRFF